MFLAQIPFDLEQGPVTMPLLGPAPAAVAALGSTAVPAAVAAPAFAAGQAPGVQNMPGREPMEKSSRGRVEGLAGRGFSLESWNCWVSKF